MVEAVDEPIEVLTLFQEGKVQPVRFRWKGRVVKVSRVTGDWISKAGTDRIYYFSILGNNADYYEIAFMASLSLGDDLLETSFAALLQARSADDVRFGIRVPEAQLEGRLMPDDESFEVAGTDLRVSGNYLGDGDWEGVLEWTFEDQLETVGAFAFSSDY